MELDTLMLPLIKVISFYRVHTGIRLQGPVVRKVDKCIHWVVIFSIVIKML